MHIFLDGYLAFGLTVLVVTGKIPPAFARKWASLPKANACSAGYDTKNAVVC